jgi:hypothetical protein
MRDPLTGRGWMVQMEGTDVIEKAPAVSERDAATFLSGAG